MKTYFTCRTLIVLFLPFILFSCHKSIDECYDTLRGPQLTMGNGKANSIFIISKHGLPQQLGIEITADGLTGLTQDPNDHHGSKFEFQIPRIAKELLAFDHIEVNWNSHGHVPTAVFDKPHFDFHFYTMSIGERNKIGPYQPSTEALFEKLPPPGFMPANFMATPGGEEKMGKHWVSKHFTPPFTHTMIYGSYNGKVNFIEPMITKAIIESGQSFNVPFDQPTLFESKDKYYPTEYNIYMDASTRKHYITLSGFVLR